MQPSAVTARAAQTSAHAGQGDDDSDTLTDGDFDSWLALGVWLTGDGVGVAVVTGTGGASEGAGTPCVAAAGEIVAFMQALSAENVPANSADDAVKLAYKAARLACVAAPQAPDVSRHDTA